MPLSEKLVRLSARCRARRNQAEKVAEPKFIRERRYFVIKISDAVQALSQWQLNSLISLGATVARHRKSLRKPALNCVVVESDWPEFEPTWRAIERRVSRPQRR